MDTTRGLVWDQCMAGRAADCTGTSTAFTWQAALDYCRSAGKRLPTVLELSSLADLRATGSNPRINTAYFTNSTVRDMMWSSTLAPIYNASSTVTAWGMSLQTGAPQPWPVTEGAPGARCVVSQPTFALHSIHPTQARVGEQVFLEGIFDPAKAVTVRFPGGVTTQDLSLKSEQRLAVSVPSGATRGLVSVTVDGQSTQGIPFRTLSYSPALSAAAVGHDETAYARRMATLATGRRGATTFVHANYIYVCGGYSDTGIYLNTCERALINADDTLGGFLGIPTTLPQELAYAAQLVLGNTLYIMGGQAGTAAAPTILDKVFTAPLLPNGDLGTFSLARTLPQPLRDAAVAVVGTYVYLLGGMSSSGITSRVLRAKISSTGAPGDFTSDTSLNLASAVSEATAAVVRNHLYVIGGRQGAETRSQLVQVSHIGVDGTLAPFSSSLALRSARGRPTAIILGDRLHVIGGNDVAPHVEWSDIVDTEGRIGSFGNGTAAVPGLNGHGQVVIGNHLYLVGGGDTSAAVYRFPLMENTSLSNFVVDSLAATPAPKANACVVAIGPHVYVFGGEHGDTRTATVHRARVAEDGVLGTFSEGAGLGLPTLLSRHTCLVDDATLRLVGGLREATGAANNIMQVMTLDATTRDVTSFEPLGQPDGTWGLVHPVTWTVGGVLMVAGDSATAATDIFGSPLPLATSLQDTMYNLIHRRAYSVGYTFGTTRFIFGSSLTSEQVSIVPSAGTVTVTPLSIAPWAHGASYLEAPTQAAGVVAGNVFYSIGGLDGASAPLPLNTVYELTLADGFPAGAAFAAGSSHLETARYGHSAMIIGNSVYVLGGRAGSASMATTTERALITSP
jgi:hypothetical protein